MNLKIIMVIFFAPSIQAIPSSYWLNKNEGGPKGSVFSNNERDEMKTENHLKNEGLDSISLILEKIFDQYRGKSKIPSIKFVLHQYWDMEEKAGCKNCEKNKGPQSIEQTTIVHQKPDHYMAQNPTFQQQSNLPEQIIRPQNPQPTITEQTTIVHQKPDHYMAQNPTFQQQSNLPEQIIRPQNIENLVTSYHQFKTQNSQPTTIPQQKFSSSLLDPYPMSQVTHQNFFSNSQRSFSQKGFLDGKQTEVSDPFQQTSFRNLVKGQQPSHSLRSSSFQNQQFMFDQQRPLIGQQISSSGNSVFQQFKSQLSKKISRRKKF